MVFTFTDLKQVNLVKLVNVIKLVEAVVPAVQNVDLKKAYLLIQMVPISLISFFNFL